MKRNNPRIAKMEAGIIFEPNGSQRLIIPKPLFTKKYSHQPIPKNVFMCLCAATLFKCPNALALVVKQIEKSRETKKPPVAQPNSTT